MQQYILGIDIGTGSTKGVAVDLTGKVICTAQHHYPTFHPEQGFSEQDPEMIWQAFVKCINDIAKQLSDAPAAISLSSALHTVISVNEQGKAISAMMTWADIRSESIAIEIRNSPQAENIYRVTGTPIHPMSPLCKLIWVRENNEALFKDTFKFVSIKAYIWYKLFGEFQVDYSIASGSGLFDIINLCWSEEVCRFAGFPVDKLSMPVNTTYTRKDLNPVTAGLLDLPADIPFVIGASDGCCANLGSFVTEPGTAALTIGTSGAVRVTGPAPIYNFGAMTFNYLLNEKTFISGGAVNNGGNAVDWVIEKFLNILKPTTRDYQDMFGAVELVPAGSGGLLFLPYLYGERAPIWDAKSSGAFLNIRPEHSQGHFLRAALEGICYALNDVLTSLETASVNITQVNISGGFTVSPTWTQLVADITGKNLFMPQPDDASALGAVYLAMDALFPDMSYPKPNQKEALSIKPDMEKHKIYTRTFMLYKKVYENVKDCMELFYNLK